MEWNDYVVRGRERRKSSDDGKWAQGDDICEMVKVLGFDPKPGRPAANSNVRTLAELASEIDTSSRRLSEAYVNSAFYGTLRRDGDYQTWSHHDKARRASGGDIEEALTLLDTAVELHLHLRAFQRYIDGVLYEGSIDTAELPARLQAFAGERARVWISIESEDDE